MTDNNKYKHFIGDRTPTMSVDLNLDRTDDFVNQAGFSDIEALLEGYGGEVQTFEGTGTDGQPNVITGRGGGDSTQNDLITQLQEGGGVNTPTNSIQQQQDLLEKLQRKQRRQQGASSFLSGLQKGLGLLGRGQQQPQQQQQTATADTASFAIPDDSGNDWQKYVLFGLLGIGAIVLIMNMSKKEGEPVVVVPPSPSNAK